MKRWSNVAIKWWSNETMKQGNEELYASSLQFSEALNASSLDIYNFLHNI